MFTFTLELYCAVIAAFVLGAVFVLIFFPGRKKQETKITGTLVIDLTEPKSPGLYLSIPSEDAITDLIRNHEKTATLNVLIQE